MISLLRLLPVVFYRWLLLSRCLFFPFVWLGFFLSCYLFNLSHFDGNQECSRICFINGTARCWMWPTRHWGLLKEWAISSPNGVHQVLFFISVLGLLFTTSGAVRCGVTHMEILLRMFSRPSYGGPTCRASSLEGIQADGQMVTSSTPCISLIHHLLSLITSQISLVLFN